jgi:hypothetical protein
MLAFLFVYLCCGKLRKNFKIEYQIQIGKGNSNIIKEKENPNLIWSHG